MEAKAYIICLLELVGVALVLTPIFLGEAKTLFVFRVRTIERLIGDILVAIGNAGGRSRNKDKNEKD